MIFHSRLFLVLTLYSRKRILQHGPSCKRSPATMTLVTNTCCSPTARGTGHPLALRLLGGGTGHPLALRLLGGGTWFPKIFSPSCVSSAGLLLRVCRSSSSMVSEGGLFCLVQKSPCWLGFSSRGERILSDWLYVCLFVYVSIYPSIFPTLSHCACVCVCVCFYVCVMVCFSLFRFPPLSSLPASSRIFLSSLPESLERISLYISVSMTSLSTYFTSQF